MGETRKDRLGVPTKSILTAANTPIIGGHHVLALQGPPERICKQNTATGALSSPHASPAGAWCSGTCCTWARSTTLRKSAWRRSIEVLEDGAARPRTLSLFLEDRVSGVRRWTPRSSASDYRNRVCAGRGSGARARPAPTPRREAAARSVLVEAAGSEPLRDALV